MTEPALTRRERQRQATMDEIVGTARGQLSEPGGLSLRGIAQEMGMTPPALYRYVSSLEDLTLIVAGSIYDELVGRLEATADRYREHGPETQILAAATAYRQWSLANRDEFVLCFVNDVTEPAAPEQNACAIAGGRFRQFFSELFIEVWKRRTFDVPSEAELGELVSTLLADPTNPFVDDHRPWEDAGVPVGAHWVFLQAWTRLFGSVALEVFGHISPDLVTSGELFRAVLRGCGEMIGLATSPELEAIVDAEIQRR